MTPAVVGFNGDEILVGMAAKQLSARIPRAVVKNIKESFSSSQG